MIYRLPARFLLLWIILVGIYFACAGAYEKNFVSVFLLMRSPLLLLGVLFVFLLALLQRGAISRMLLCLCALGYFALISLKLRYFYFWQPFTWLILSEFAFFVLMLHEKKIGNLKNKRLQAGTGTLFFLVYVVPLMLAVRFFAKYSTIGYGFNMIAVLYLAGVLAISIPAFALRRMVK